MLCLQTYHSFSGGQGTCYGEGFLLSPKTLPLSAHLPFFMLQSGTCQFVLLLPVSCVSYPCTLNSARAPDLIIHIGMLALQLLAQF